MSGIVLLMLKLEDLWPPTPSGSRSRPASVPSSSVFVGGHSAFRGIFSHLLGRSRPYADIFAFSLHLLFSSCFLQYPQFLPWQAFTSLGKALDRSCSVPRCCLVSRCRHISSVLKAVPWQKLPLFLSMQQCHGFFLCFSEADSGFDPV